MMPYKIMRKKLIFLRAAGITEGISFLVLLFIAMPLKYFLQLPIAVTIAGWIHGVLFVTFISMAWEVKGDLNKKTKWLLWAVAAAFLPAGTFFFDRKLKEELTTLEGYK